MVSGVMAASRAAASAKGMAAESAVEGTEPVSVIGFRGETHDGRGAAVEISRADDHSGHPVCNALDPVTPTAGRLDRGFHRLGARVHGKHAVHPGEAAELFGEGAEAVAMVAARGDGEAACLLVQDLQDAGFVVAEAHRAVGAQEIEVFFALEVPNPAPLGAAQSQRQGGRN